MTAALILFCLGLASSAFFSGSETGMYRVSRTRMVLDALSGSRSAKGIVWLLNHPTFFVATALIGNNLANYATSSAMVMTVGALFAVGSGASGGSIPGGIPGGIAGSMEQWRSTAELVGPILVTPLVFVLGELSPKHLFYRAPYRLIRLTSPLLLASAVLFAPMSWLLGQLGRLLQRATGQTPFRLRLMMNRGQLDRVLRDGHEAGILAAGQRDLATKLFEVGDRPAASFAVPVGRLATVDSPIDVTHARHQARRRNHPIILVRRGKRIVGFVHYADLCVNNPRFDLHPVVHARGTDRHLRLLLRMYDANVDVAVLHDEKNDVQSIVTTRQLISPVVKPTV